MKLNRIEIHAADHCVQRCRHCSHAADIAAKKFYKPEDYRFWFQKLVSADIEFETIDLLGGEPFLCPDLTDLAVMASAYADHVGSMTNAFWLKDEASIDRYADPLEVLSHLVVTLYDPLVEKCGGLANVRRLLDVVRSKFPTLNVFHFVNEPMRSFAEIKFHDDAKPVIQPVCNFRNCKQLMTDGRVLGCCVGLRLPGDPRVDTFYLSKPFESEDFVEWFEQPELNLCNHCTIATEGVKMVDWELLDTQTKISRQ